MTIGHRTIRTQLKFFNVALLSICLSFSKARSLRPNNIVILVQAYSTILEFFKEVATFALLFCYPTFLNSLNCVFVLVPRLRAV